MKQYRKIYDWNKLSTDCLHVSSVILVLICPRIEFTHLVRAGYTYNRIVHVDSPIKLRIEFKLLLHISMSKRHVDAVSYKHDRDIARRVAVSSHSPLPAT